MDPVRVLPSLPRVSLPVRLRLLRLPRVSLKLVLDIDSCVLTILTREYINNLCSGYEIDDVAAPKKLTKAEREEARVKAAGKTLIFIWKIQSLLV